MQKVFLSLTLAAAVAGCGTANAADNLPPPPYRAPAPIYMPPTWSGLYVGFNAGYGFGTTENNSAALGATFNTDPRGVVAGGQLGYNWQLPSNVVLGVETDMQWANVKGSGTLTIGGLFWPINVAIENKLNWLGTTRGRVGYAWQNLLLFASGGVAYGGVKSTFDVGQSFSTSSTQVGWSAGAGAEVLFGNTIVGVEYLYYDLSHRATFQGIDVNRHEGKPSARQSRLEVLTDEVGGLCAKSH